ncbi:flagellar protein FlaG [Paenibacillus rigui]|uniref:Flagellar biosynthesis protein FlaG n=1 Tax=Paenibacillus rigui TaxID=554312 RepID=A0A229UTY1_9BACL|nr:flagellar protein FlaG [Paenibacillus rigui]OXM86359.1 hypothetical protein CF651_10520 [Paenibacillus rigui]
MSIQPTNLPKVTYSNLTGSTAEGQSVTESVAALASSTELMRKEKYELSISEEAVVQAVERANKALAGVKSHAEYSVHKPHGDIVVKLINSETKEVIREIPPEKILDLLDKFEELNGTIIDEKR